LDPQLPQTVVGLPSVEAEAGEPLDIAVLTGRMVAGEEMAYRTFYHAYFDRLSRYLLVVASGHEESAREALQATFVRVVRHIRVFPNDTVFWSWLTVLARSALTDQTRKRQRYVAFLERFTEASRIHRATAEPKPVETELLGRLERNLAELPFDERDLLERKYFARESVRQIAAELHTTEKGVESRLGRIRRKLKVVLLQSLGNE
jgi:RNA polymerase sigma factor (sigma-70 family)